MDTCKYVSETLCPDQWVRVLDFLKLPGISDNVERYNLPFINCTDPGAALNQLPHCCSDAGIEISTYCICTLYANLPSMSCAVLLCY